MRKFYLFALVAALFAACTTDVTKDVTVEVPQTLTVSFEEDTRIQLMNGKTVWNTGDLVSVFYKSDANDCYKFTGTTGDRTSELVRTAKGEKSRSGDHIITVYPYSKDYIISLSDGTIEAHLPAEQTYIDKSFGIGSSPMVSMSEYKQVVLKNVCGWLKVQFTGNGEVVDKITLRGNCGEQVAGDIMIVAEDASTILASAGMDIDDTEVGGTLVDEDSIITEVSLICPDGVTLGSEPTSFYIALPPQTFSKGLTVTLYSDKSGAMKQTTDKSITISRNIVQPLASVEANLQPNKIYYTSTDGNIVTPYSTTAFSGANIISNTYEDNQGVIIFDAPVTEIGDYAFYKCSSLTSVTIPNSVTKIGGDAFYYCRSLTSVTIPNSVTEIEGYAFRLCRSLTSVTIPDSVTEIGSNAFYKCSSLTSVTIPNSVTTLERNPFAGCSKLTEFNGKFASADKRCLIVDGVLNSFAPAGLTHYTIPDSVTEIGDEAFRNCSSLTSVTIPDSVTEIGYSAFEDCSSLTSVTIGNSVTEIGSDAFYYCSSLKSVYCNAAYPPALVSSTFGNTALENIYVYAESVDTYKAKWSDYADMIVSNNKSNSDSITFTYTSTDGKAINESNLNLVVKSNSYTNGVGTLVVYGTAIPDKSFYQCTTLKTITIPDSVTEIGSSAFRSCSSLTSVTIPDSVTKIEGSAFRGCSSLTSVSIGNSVTSIGSGAFYNCSSLTSVTIPDSVTTIVGWAFYGCSSLTSVTIPDSVTTLGANPFRSCSKLTEFIGKFASADKRCLIVNGVLNSFAPAGLTEYTIPDSVTKIGGYAFGYCSSLTSVTIPDSVTDIGYSAFEDCNSLTSVTIPDSVTAIGYSAFSGCRSLKSIYLAPTTPPQGGSDMFLNNATGRKIYVPRASESAYEAAEYWRDYAADIEPYDF